jgi:serine/threonine protein kinase
VYSTKSDVWSFGVVISEILNREEPHKEIEDVIEVAIAIRNELKTPKIEESAPELLKEIMKQCWAINPDERPVSTSLNLPYKLTNFRIRKWTHCAKS